MKKLYKKSYHTVFYMDIEKDDLDEELEENLIKFFGFSTSQKLDEVNSLDDLPPEWSSDDLPMRSIHSEEQEHGYYFNTSYQTIGEILEQNKTQSLEEQIKDLKGENEALKAQLFAIKQYVSI